MAEELTLAKVFDWMTTRFDRIDERFEAGEDRFDKLELITSETLKQATATNGKVADHERRISATEAVLLQEKFAAEREAGAKDQREKDVALLKKILALLLEQRFIQTVGFAVLAAVGWWRL